VWYLGLLFDSEHARILSPERNLLFLVFDSFAVIATVGLWLRAAASQPSVAASAGSAAVSTFTLNGTPAGYHGCRANVATALGTGGGLLLIGAGLALLVGLLGDRFHRGPPEEYTGPQLRRRPARKPWNRREGGGSDDGRKFR
jgi:hypothetical protein